MTGSRAGAPSPPDGAPGAPGRWIVRASWAGTVLFVVAAVPAVVVVEPLASIAAVVDLLLFALGIGAFGWSLVVAAGRSREEAVSVAELYGLAGGTAPAGVRRALLGSVAVQVVGALAAAAVRPFTPLAFAVLVPVYGVGLSGLWAARHGRFGPRTGQVG